MSIERGRLFKPERQEFLRDSPTRNLPITIAERVTKNNKRMSDSPSPTKESLYSRNLKMLEKHSQNSRDSGDIKQKSPPKQLQRQLTREEDPMSQSMK